MNLAECNYCEVLMEDSNPAVESIDFDEDELNGVVINHETIAVGTGEDRHWVCPVCKKDSFLMDVVDESQLIPYRVTPAPMVNEIKVGKWAIEKLQSNIVRANYVKGAETRTLRRLLDAAEKEIRALLLVLEDNLRDKMEYSCVFFSRQNISIDGEDMPESIFQEERVPWSPENRLDLIGTIKEYLSEASSSDYILMEEDITYLESLPDEWVFNNSETNKYVGFSDNPLEFNEICRMVLAEYNKGANNGTR